MPSVRLSFQQILEAARQLPAVQRQSLVKNLARRPSSDEILTVARQLRPAFRFGPKKRRRMSHLTAKSSEGRLTAPEQAELNELVEETTENSLRMAEALNKAVEILSRKNLAANGMTKR